MTGFLQQTWYNALNRTNNLDQAQTYMDEYENLNGYRRAAQEEQKEEEEERPVLRFRIPMHN